MSKTVTIGVNRLGGCLGVGFVLLFGLVWSGGTLSCDGVIAWGIFRQLRAVGYPTAEGHITHSEVEKNPGRNDKSPTYRPNLKYTFYLGDQAYDGSQYRYGGLGWSNKTYAQRIVAEYPVDKHVVVHYRPDEPSDAVLRVGIGGEELFMAMFLAPFNLVMLAIWIGVGGSLYARIAKPLAGGAKVWDDGDCVRVRLASIGPLAAAAVGIGAMSFAAVFVVAFGFGADPKTPVMLVTWAVILVAAMWIYLYRRRKLAQGDADLLIDNFAQTVAFPRTLGRKERVVVPMRRFLAVEVERVQKTDSEGGSFWRYVPIATFSDEAGTTRRERIVEWSSRARAEGLAAWLRDQLRIEQPDSRLQ